MKTQSRKRRSSSEGFSLAELMVVIVIIGLLATLVVPNVVAKLFTASNKKAIADINSIAQAVTEYAIQNNGSYPDSLEALITEDSKGFKILDRETIPRDPWGNEYYYEPPTSGQNFVLLSYGKDGTPGGEADGADITYSMIRNGEI